MYRIFRDNKQKLPGDEEFIKNQKPSIRIVLQPLITDDNNLSLPKLEFSQLTLQPNMVIESLKKFIKLRLENKIEPNYEISLSYKNLEMLDHYTIKDIESIYSFTGEKTIFYYSKKQGLNNTNETKTNQAINTTNIENDKNLIDAQEKSALQTNNSMLLEENNAFNGINDTKDFDNQEILNTNSKKNDNKEIDIDLNC